MRRSFPRLAHLFQNVADHRQIAALRHGEVQRSLLRSSAASANYGRRRIKIFVGSFKPAGIFLRDADEAGAARRFAVNGGAATAPFPRRCASGRTAPGAAGLERREAHAEIRRAVRHEPLPASGSKQAIRLVKKSRPADDAAARVGEFADQIQLLRIERILRAAGNVQHPFLPFVRRAAGRSGLHRNGRRAAARLRVALEPNQRTRSSSSRRATRAA